MIFPSRWQLLASFQSAVLGIFQLMECLDLGTLYSQWGQVAKLGQEKQTQRFGTWEVWTATNLWLFYINSTSQKPSIMYDFDNCRHTTSRFRQATRTTGGWAKREWWQWKNCGTQTWESLQITSIRKRQSYLLQNCICSNLRMSSRGTCELGLISCSSSGLLHLPAISKAIRHPSLCLIRWNSYPSLFTISEELPFLEEPASLSTN